MYNDDEEMYGANNRGISATGRARQQSQGRQSQGRQSQGRQSQGRQSQGGQSQGRQSQGQQMQGQQMQGQQMQGQQMQGQQMQGQQMQGQQSQLQAQLQAEMKAMIQAQGGEMRFADAERMAAASMGLPPPLSLDELEARAGTPSNNQLYRLVKIQSPNGGTGCHCPSATLPPVCFVSPQGQKTWYQNACVWECMVKTPANKPDWNKQLDNDECGPVPYPTNIEWPVKVVPTSPAVPSPTPSPSRLVEGFSNFSNYGELL